MPAMQKVVHRWNTPERKNENKRVKSNAAVPQAEAHETLATRERGPNAVQFSRQQMATAPAAKILTPPQLEDENEQIKSAYR
jgi:hypothetical protein